MSILDTIGLSRNAGGGGCSGGNLEERGDWG